MIKIKNLLIFSFIILFMLMLGACGGATDKTSSTTGSKHEPTNNVEPTTAQPTTTAQPNINTGINLGNISYKGLVYNVFKNEATCIGYDGIPETINIPSYIIHDDYPIVKIPVTSIGFGAFSGCKKLINVEMPDSITCIADYAFSTCINLTNVTIPNTVTNLGHGVFTGCSNLTSITIPNSVTYIADYLLNDCRKLKNIVIPNSVTSIGECAFRDCSSLTSVEMPNNVTSIGSSAFSRCSSLTSIEIPSNITSIGSNAFSGCKNLIYNIYDNGKYLGNEGNPYLVLIKTISTDITTIETNDNTKIIGSSAFSGCSSLTNIEIPSSVRSIENYAFSGCKNLIYNTYDNGKYLGNEENPYLVLIKAISTDITTIKINNNTKFIYSQAFKYCSNITTIEIPNNIICIGSYAFDHSYRLTSVVFEKRSQLVSIRNGAFNVCSNLTSINIPEGLTSIGYSAFNLCSNLTNMEIPSSVISIGGEAFSGCYGLTNIKIPSSVKSIGEKAFFACYGLTNIEVDKNNNTYDSRNDCNAIIETATNALILGCQYTKIPNGVIRIENNTFSYCVSLISITIPISVTSIGKDAFSACQSLTSVTFEEGSQLTSIGARAFENCNNLANMEIPSSVTSIGTAVFSGCRNLAYNIYDNANYLGNETNPYLLLVRAASNEITTCNINSNTRFIYDDAFSYCSNLTSIILPNTVTSIDHFRFNECVSLSIVFYNGTTDEWLNMNSDSSSRELTSATIYYYSETQPTEEGNYWHYDADGITPVAW